MSDSPITMKSLGVLARGTMTVQEAQRESHACSVDKGWHENDNDPPNDAQKLIAHEMLRIGWICQQIELHRKGKPREAGYENMLTPAPFPGWGLAGFSDTQIRALSWLGLICSEVAEAAFDVKVEHWGTTVREDGKPEGLGSEAADILIRVFDHFTAMGVDLEAELRLKQAYNRTRPHRHGGKAA